MKRKWLFVLIGLLLGAGLAQAETIHLRTGEVIQGTITQVDAETISIESKQGFGVIQINRSEIALIEFEEGMREMDGKMGIGYAHSVTPNTTSTAQSDYALDSFSFKFWISSFSSLDFLVGFYSATTAEAATYEVFSYDLRFATVFQRMAGLDMYSGASLGIISVKDDAAAVPVDDSGTRWQAFLGAEMFFSSMPNLGISSEVGFGTQTVGNATVTNISTTTFPTFSLHYYF